MEVLTIVPFGGGTASVAGSNTEIQYNDNGSLGASADLTWDDTGKELGVGGDINLDDGGTYSTTLQMVTATANRTISFPDATGTVALVAGSSGQVTYNNAGAQAGLTSASIGSTDEINISLAGAASTPPVSFTGSWFTGGTSTTTKPQLLIEPTGTTSTAWSTSGTGLGVNAASGFAGRLLDLQTNGTSRMVVQGDGKLGLGTSSPAQLLDVRGTGAVAHIGNTDEYTQFGTFGAGTSERPFLRLTDGSGSWYSQIGGKASDGAITNTYFLSNVGIGTTNPTQKLQITDGSLSNFYIAPGYNGGTGTTIGVGGGEYLAFNGAPFTTERMRIDISGRLLVGTSTSPSAFPGANSNLVVQGYVGQPTSGGIMSLQRGQASASIGADQLLGRIGFNGSDGYSFADITARSEAAAGSGSYPGALVFSTTADGASSPTERMRIKANGVINFSSCPTYADDAAAGTGGLVAGDIYKTSTGELRIKL